MRLIDSEALIKELKHSFDCASSTGYIRKLNELQKTDIIKIVFSAIDNAPTVDYCPYLSDDEVKQPCVQGPCSGEHERR